MAEKHIIKLTEGEAVIKLYTALSSGNTIVVSLENDLTLPGETYVAGQSQATIRKIFWGTKTNKHIDLRRGVLSSPGTWHGHYYLMTSGSYDFVGFVDNTYSTGDVQVISDGEFHMLLVLGKTGWN